MDLTYQFFKWGNILFLKIRVAEITKNQALMIQNLCRVYMYFFLILSVNPFTYVSPKFTTQSYEAY